MSGAIWTILIPHKWNGLCYCQTIYNIERDRIFPFAMQWLWASAEAASILQFFWDSEMNWGVRKKIHYTFDRNSLISMLGLIFIWNLSLFVFSIAEWSPSLSSAFWYTLVKELFTPVSHVIFIWGHNYPGMGSKRRRLTSQLAKVWRPYRLRLAQRFVYPTLITTCLSVGNHSSYPIINFSTASFD